MTTLSVQTLSPSGTAPSSLVAVGGSGDLLPNNGKAQVDIHNGSGGVLTVTISAQIPCDMGTLHDITNTIADGATETMGPFSSRYNDSSGLVHIGYSTTSTVTIRAYTPS
jgi:hypothetical protein